MTKAGQQPDARAPLARTPALDALLRRLERRVVLAVLAYGLGAVLLGTTAWLAFAFVADYGLHVPRAVRFVHLGVAIALPVLIGWRLLARPLSRVPDRAGLAHLIERETPPADRLFESAVELQREPAGRADPLREELVGRVLERADAAARGRSVAGALREGPPRALLAAGAAVAGAFSLALAANPEHAAIYLDRLVGGTTPWPQRTRLALELPGSDGFARVEREGEVLRVELARGRDLPVLVRVEGVVPDRVELVLDGEHEVSLSPAGDRVFRTVLRGVQTDLTAWPVGGDDRDGLPRLELTVLEPPDVARVAVRVEPPAHTGLAPAWSLDRDVRVVAGSRVTVVALTDPPGVGGVARLLPADTELPLLGREWPAAAVAAAGDLEAAAIGDPAVGFEWTATESVRFRLELVDERGLGNPDPGLFAVDVVEDRVPEVALLAPGRNNAETVPGGTLPLRARAEDDFGLTGLAWRVRDAAAEDWERGEPLEAAPLAGAVTAEGRPPRALLGHRRLAVEALAGPEATDLVGRQFELEVVATDNASPPGEGTSPRLRVRVLSSDELLRRVQDRLSRARLDATALQGLQTDRRARVQDLLASLAGDGPLEGADSRNLQAALNGQRRVEGDAESLLRELAAVTEQVLYARVDSEADALLDALDASLASVEDRGFRPEPWRELVDAQRENGLGEGGFAAHLVQIVGVALEVHDTGATVASAALDDALAARELPELRGHLDAALAAQNVALAQLEDLLARLAEWDNFQSVLALTRDILERQRSLSERTRRIATDR